MAAAVAIFPQQVVAVERAVAVHITLPQGGVLLGLGKQPTKVLLQPVHKACAQCRTVWGCVSYLGFALEDALAQGVVQVDDFAGVVALPNLDGGQAVVAAAQAVAGVEAAAGTVGIRPGPAFGLVQGRVGEVADEGLHRAVARPLARCAPLCCLSSV